MCEYKPNVAVIEIFFL